MSRPRGDGVDIAIRTGSLPRGSNSRVVKLPSHGFVVVAAPSYIDRRGRPSTPDELTHHDVCTVRTSTRWVRWPFSRRGQSAVVDVVPRVEVNDVEMAVDLVLEGAGVTVLPDYMAADHVRAKRLVSLLPGWGLPEMPVVALHPPTRQMSGPARALLGHLRRELRPRAADSEVSRSG